MRILAIDSSGMTASVALATDKKVEAVYSVNYHLTHSQTLLPMLSEIRNMTQTDLSTVDAVAVAQGPGSFTGLRIGVATAKGLCLALDKPLIGVPTLEGLAWNLWGSNSLICPMMDARRNQVYTAVYTFSYDDAADADAFNTCLEVIEKQTAVPVQEMILKLNALDRDVVFLGDGCRVYKEQILDQIHVPAHFAPAHLMEQNAASVAVCACGMYERGQVLDAASFSPDYLRVSQAEREREEKKRAAEKTIRCREMTGSDLKQVAAIERETFSEPWSEESFLSSLLSPDTLYVVAARGDEEEVVGYAGLLCSFENADITNVAVRMSDRRNGIGRRMMEELIRAGQERGVRNFALEVRKSNTAAVELYRQMGFEIEGVRKNYYKAPKEDALIMWKRGGERL